MNRSQKIACFMVINAGVALLLSLVVFGVGIFYFKVSVSKAAAGFGFMGLMGFSGFTPILFKKEPGAVEFDERDIKINRKAALAGFASSYLYMCLACMLPFFIMGPKATISVVWLPNILLGGWVLTSLVYSITILVLYGKGDKDE